MSVNQGNVTPNTVPTVFNNGVGMQIPIILWYNCKIVTDKEPVVQKEMALYKEILERLRKYKQVKTISIYLSDRTPDDAPHYQYPGWIEWVVRLVYENGTGLTINCVQHTPTSRIVCTPSGGTI